MKARSLLLWVAAAIALVFVECGGDGSHEALVSISVSPASGIATHSSPSNTVQFAAGGNFALLGTSFGTDQQATGACLLKTIDKTRSMAQVTWSTSDSISTSIDSGGVATCIGVTSAPATITAFASGICGGVKGTAILNCD
jgi:hypothetical protein